MRQKVVLWFSEQIFLFLTFFVFDFCHVLKKVLQIKHGITDVVMSCPYLLANYLNRHSLFN